MVAQAPPRASRPVACAVEATSGPDTPQTTPVIAIFGGLGAAVLWATATLASSRSSRMIGSRVVLAWVMIIGTAVGLPIGLVSGIPVSVSPGAAGLLLLAGACYAGGLYAAYSALTVGKVGIVAPIVASEGAVAALIAVALGDELAISAAVLLAMIVAGVVLSSIEPAHPDVLAGDFEIAADALEGPAPADGDRTVASGALHPADADTRRAVILAILAAAIFGVGLVSTGKAAMEVPPIWVAIAVRLVGLLVVALPLVLQRRLTLTRAILPLVLIAGTGEIIGSTLSAWGSAVNIPITAVLGSQFAAIAAVLAFLLFGERLSRTQVLGVILIVAGVSALATTSI
jgi:drug/metabolite transporter (DMT)-like permease